MNFFDDILLLDGAMGTELLKAKAPMGKVPEELNIDNPKYVMDVHKAYCEAGSDIIYSNTFSANAYKCKDSKYTPQELVTAAVKNAIEVAKPYGAKVAMSMGTIGDILEPFGNLKFEQAYDMYKEMIIAGEKAGAELIVFETQTDLLEVKAGVLAAKENSTLPIMVTMTFEKNGRTFTGTGIEAMAVTLSALGVDAIGINCSLGPKDLLPLVKKMREYTDLPIAVKPNAGLPDSVTGKYSMTPEEFSKEMIPFLEMGVSMVGGCCGTTPEFIKALKARAKQYKPIKPMKNNHSYLSSGRMVVDITKVHPVGERINPTGKKLFKEALLNHDLDYVMKQAIEQVEAGAQILDVNVGIPTIDEPALMEEVVKKLQTIVDVPLQIDSSDPKAIEAALRHYNGKALINSVNGEDEVLDKILPIAHKYGAAVIGLTMDKNGIPSECEKRVEIAGHIVEKCAQYGIEPKDIYIDCLTLTVSVQQKEAFETLKAIRAVKEKYGVHTVLGVSNISFGLPKREYINTTFLTLALNAGLDLPIINPNSDAMMGAVDAFTVLSSMDENATEYVEKYARIQALEKEQKEREKALKAKLMTDVSGKEQGNNDGLHNAEADEITSSIKKGLSESVAKAVEALLEVNDALDIVNNKLIPALDEVGKDFESGKLFLPQLLSAATAASAGFDVIKKKLAAENKESVSKGKIVLATVKGDVHDIGKNIVKTILENYGYTVIDLGKDVDPEKVVEAVKKDNIKLVGLSALMTTTVASMEETIKALKEAGCDCKIMVGGAVLTPDFAAKIGADFYSKDAKQSADIANSIFA